MSELKDRYVAAVLRSIPEDRQTDVEAELLAAIEDAVDTRVESGADPIMVESAVLTDLGDPDRLAADYSDRPLWLIGPRYYLPWLRATKRLLTTIPPIVAVIVAVVDLAAGESLLAALFGGLVAALITALNVMFWTTLGFVLAERSGDVKKSDIEPLHAGPSMTSPPFPNANSTMSR